MVLSIAAFLRVCGSSEPEAPPPPAVTATAPSPPPGTAPVTVDSPPPPAVGAGAAVVGSAEVRMVQAGPREVRLYGLHGGRRLPASQLRVRRARILTAEGPRVIVLEPRDDYYVAVTPYDLPPTARFDVEVGFVADPTPPAVVVVDGFAPRASVEVAAWVPGPPGVTVIAPPPPSVHVVAPAPPAVRVRGGVHVDARVLVPAPPAVVIVPPRPPSISIGIGVPSPRVVVVGEARGDGHRGRGKGHVIGRGRGHSRH